MNLDELLKVAQGAQRLNFVRDEEGWVPDCDTFDAQPFIATFNPEVCTRLVRVAMAAQAFMDKKDQGHWGWSEEDWDAFASLRAALRGDGE